VFNDNPDKFKYLEPLGTACRYQYNIEDFEDDIAAGYVNISKEDCDRFEINLEDLRKMSPNVKLWLQHHAEEGMALLADHHRIMPKGNFSMLERVVFKVVYEIPAKKAFRKVLSKQEPYKT
jgi:ATP-dependent protease Clp ATPase subunit